ncbi:MAG: RNA-binding protein [Myxococcales bacterium]|nr:RNA-binding protein [Myxococcales bacterium]
MAAKDFIEFIARHLAQEPDDVEVIESQGMDEQPLYELRVNEKDRGRVIGKKGRTAHAIRSLLSASAKDGEKPRLDIVD